MRGNATEQRMGTGARRVVRGISKRLSSLKSKPTSRKGKSPNRKGSLVYSEKREEKSLKTQIGHKEKMRKH